MVIPNFGQQPTVELQPQREVATVTEIKNEKQFLDFESEKVQSITLDQLERTNKENRGDDRSCPHGIYHYAMIERILDMCSKAGYNAEVYDLFATNNRDKQTPGVSLYPELEAQYGERAIEAHTLRRVYCNIRLTNFDDESLTTNMAISYTQKGIQVGFGSMVKVCHNQNMLGHGMFVSDYSTHNKYAGGDPYKTDLKGIFETVGRWLTDADHVVINDRETIEKMKQSVFTAQQLFMILGILHATRVQCDTQIKEIRPKGISVYPLNQMQLNKFTESLLKTQHDTDKVTVWDFYNAATELYKAKTCEQNMILVQNLAMVDFINQYQLY